MKKLIFSICATLLSVQYAFADTKPNYVKPTIGDYKSQPPPAPPKFIPPKVNYPPLILPPKSFEQNPAPQIPNYRPFDNGNTNSTHSGPIYFARGQVFFLTECPATPFEKLNWNELPRTLKKADEYEVFINSQFEKYGELKFNKEFKRHYQEIFDIYLEEIKNLSKTEINFVAIERELGAQNQSFKDCLTKLELKDQNYDRIRDALQAKYFESVSVFDAKAEEFIANEDYVDSINSKLKRFSQILSDVNLESGFLKERPEVKLRLKEFMPIIKGQLDGKYEDQKKQNPDQKCFLKPSHLIPVSGFDFDNAYPARALESEMSGAVTIKSVVNNYGEPISIEFVSASHEFFTGDSVRNAAMKRLFRPNVQNCIPMGGEYTYNVRFSVN